MSGFSSLSRKKLLRNGGYMINLGDYFNIGDAWLAVLRIIEDSGSIVIDGNETYREVKGVVFSAKYNSSDFILDLYAKPENILWMKKNFTSFSLISELRNARSYASRIFSYGGQKNQLEWVANKLKMNRNTRSATITMLEPLTDVSYIPCISMLDFDVSEDKLNIYVYARALDFGGKEYANMLSIWDILKEVSAYTGIEIGRMIWICKSVHYYSYDFEWIKEMLGELNEYKPCVI